MNIVNITLGVDTQPCSSITLGRRGENEVTQVVVDFSSWVEEFGAGVITLLAMRSQDTSAYPVVLTLDGNTATWDVTSTDTAYKGSGRAEYIYTVGEQIAKSVVFNTVVMQDIGEPSETPPDPYEDWLERLTELGAETQANAEAAQQSAEDAEQSAQEAAQEAANAEGYAEQSGESASAAQSAEAASESARDEAQAAQASSEFSATAASGSAASAASSATAAAGSATDASSSASSAGVSATAASASATTASNAATAAQTAQSAAEDAAADAQQAAQQAHVEYEQLSGEVDDLSDEVADQKSAIDDLEALTNRKAGMLVDTASGAIASFVPDATIDNLLGVSVDIEPVQDLHGYDSPWPAGGGKNLLDPATATGSAVTWGGVTLSTDQDSEVISLSGTAIYNGGRTALVLKTIHLAAGTYYISASNTSGVQPQVIVQTVSGGTYTVIGDRANIAFSLAQDSDIAVGFNIISGTTYATTLKLQIESGSTATSYAPYENICPISGWDSVEVGVNGENLLPYTPTKGAASRTETFNPETCFFLKQGTYTFAFDRFDNATSWRFGIVLFDARKERYYVPSEILGNDFGHNDSGRYYVNGSNRTDTAFSLTMPFDGFIRLFFLLGDTTDASVCVNPRICIGTTAHAYHPYAGNTYTIALGQTVYGGTLTIAEDGSVNALVDRARVVYDGSDDETWERYSSGSASAFAMSIHLAHAFDYTGANIISNYLTSIPNGATWGDYDNWISSTSGDGGTLVTGIKSITDVTTWRAYLANNPLEVCYELATPIVITLDPVAISTIANQTNNVWANTGDVSVKFAADLKAYIDRLNQSPEDDMIANSLIAANKYFTINNRLFLSTASIAAGAMIIPGTNCQETSLAAALNALNA